MLEVAANVRFIIQKIPMADLNKGLDMVRDGSVRYRVVFED